MINLSGIRDDFGIYNLHAQTHQTYGHASDEKGIGGRAPAVSDLLRRVPDDSGYDLDEVDVPGHGLLLPIAHAAFGGHVGLDFGGEPDVGAPPQVERK